MPSTKSSYHHGNLRSALIGTTQKLIAEKGTDGLTMRELSRAIGVSRMAAYRHFANKIELLCAVAEDGFRKLSARYAAMLAQERPDGLAALEKVGRMYVAFALEHPALYNLMFGPTLAGEDRPDSMRQAADEAFGYLIRAVEDCQRRGLLRPGESLPIAGLLWSTMHGLSSLLIEGKLSVGNASEGLPLFLTDQKGVPSTQAGSLLDLAVDVLFRGLVPRPSGSAE